MNQSFTIHAADASDLYLRVQDDTGQEQSFAGLNTADAWPTNGNQFEVSKEPDDAQVRVLRSGAGLSNTVNYRPGAGDPLPDCWTLQRFFRCPGNRKLQIQPQ